MFEKFEGIKGEGFLEGLVVDAAEVVAFAVEGGGGDQDQGVFGIVFIAGELFTQVHTKVFYCQQTGAADGTAEEAVFYGADLYICRYQHAALRLLPEGGG